MKILEIKDLNFGYDGTEILKNINLDIYKNDFVGIIGNNGVGKSTILKLIIGELKNYSGVIKIFDKEQKSFKDWKLIGYVPQIDRSNLVAFPISVKEIILFNMYNEFLICIMNLFFLTDLQKNV